MARTQITLIHDVAMAMLAFVAALWLRLGWPVMAAEWPMATLGTAVFAIIAAVVFRAVGLHRGVWRYASLEDTLAILRAATLTALIAVFVQFLATRASDLPRTAVPLAWLFLVGLLAAPRFVYRVAKDRAFGRLLQPMHDPKRVPVLLVGAGDEADLFIKAMARPAAAYRVVGLIDDRPRRRGQAIRGVSVLGGIADLPGILARLAGTTQAPQRLVLAHDVALPQLDTLIDLAAERGLALARLPRLTDFRDGGDAVPEIRPIALEDLLNRPQATLDRAAIAGLIAGRRVLITGAGGTIGAELTHQIAGLAPARLCLLEASEYALYQIDLALSERYPDVPRRAILADIRNRQHLNTLCAEERPELVFHAAALKHVPLVEANPDEGVLTNVIGTRNLAECAREAGALALVLISTDKAINPTSVMGATKRLAEAWCQTLDRAESKRSARGESGMRCVTVRFGNVLGSTGSVVPLFERQLARGGPLTVTHPDMTRYFMTVREAVELVLQASALGVGDTAGAGKILVLDMGEPVRIYDLARQMIRLAGRTLGRDVAIVFTGLRPGEKLAEELFHDAESAVETMHKGIRVADPRTADQAMLARALDELEAAARARRTADVLQLLGHLVPEFRRATVADPPVAVPAQLAPAAAQRRRTPP